MIQQARGPRVHERWAHLRFSVIGQLLAAPPPKGELRAEIEALAGRQWRHPITGDPARFGFSTIERWYYRALKERSDLILFAKAFGLVAIEDHRSAEADGIVRIEVVDQGGRLGYIPYTDKPINWHTDGYYNFHGPDRAVRAMLLHCMRPAAKGGVNRLLDPEIAYIRLRDSDPGHIEALMHPEAMTIPASVEANGRVRPENVGPVFYVDARSGALGMRFTARKRNVVWRDDPSTRAAVATLEAILREDPLCVETRMEAGQGLVCNNVLHDRTAFATSQDAGRGRLLYRVRYADRIGGGGGFPS